MKRICLTLAICGFLSVSAYATPISGVKTIKISDNGGGDWFYLEEVNIYNVAGTDVASLAFGATGTPNFGPAFGSTATGAIDDIVANCCGTGTHGAVAASAGVENYTIVLPSVQDIDAIAKPIEIHNRLDGCCPARPENIDIEFFDAGGTPILVDDGTGVATAVFSVNGAGDFTTNFGYGGGTLEIEGIIPEPSSGILLLIGMAMFACRRRCGRNRR